MDGIANPPANAGCIVKDQQGRHTADKFKDILEPLADTFRRFTAEYLAVTVITVRERNGKVFLSDKCSRFVEISLAKIHLGRTRVPDKLQIRFFNPLGTEFFQIALDDAVTAGIAVFFCQTFIDALCCVVLFAQCFLSSSSHS